MAFRMRPMSAFPATEGKVYPDVLRTNENDFWIEGLGVMASLDSDAELHYLWHTPAVLPTGTCKLEVLAFSYNADGDAKFNPKWKSLAIGENFDLAATSLNAEGTQTLTWTNEIQTVTLTDATAGTFTLTFDGQTTSTIAYDATAAAVQSALEALSNLDSGDVTVTGDAGGPWAVEFDGQGDVALMTADDSSLTGTAGVALTQESNGHEFLRAKVTLDADTIVADEIVALRLAMESTSWTLNKRSIWLPAIIWE